MNIESYNLDSLRDLVRKLQKENNELKDILLKNDIPFASGDVFESIIEDHSEYDPDQGERIVSRWITDEMVKLFYSVFWGREDVFAKRGKNGGYFPQCENFWKDTLCPKKNNSKFKCDDCENRHWKRLELYHVRNHLFGYKEDGSDVIGVYPLYEDGTCRFIVYDFDNHEKGSEQTDFANTDNEWQDEVNALREICESNGIRPLVERSRSGRGAHVWISFSEPVNAGLARNFGFMLLDKGMMSYNLKTFKYYDRMYPCQDNANSLGNLIALPLQGRALKNGNSAFVDANWNAYPDQWSELLDLSRRLSLNDIMYYMEKWQAEIAQGRGFATIDNSIKRVKPWKKRESFISNDVVGKMHITLSDGIYVDALNLAPRLQNQIRSLAAFDNPEFYKRLKMRKSNYYQFQAIYLGRDTEGYIIIPRGLREEIISECKTADIPYEIIDEREKGIPIKVSFNGELKEEQQIAVDKMLSFDNGVLSAATAFGKTVVSSYIIAQRKVNTLIILQSKDLLEQWVESLQKFLDIDEEPPTYKTKTGRIKTRESVIGRLSAGKDTLTGIIDVAMVGSLYAKGNYHNMMKKYGMVIMDECHHVASSTGMNVMQNINARYVYGFTATPKRSDQLDKEIFMLIGPIRHSYSALERVEKQGIPHVVYPRFTRTVRIYEDKNDPTPLYKLISGDNDRNDMIIDDTRFAVKEGRTPVILTRFKEHAKYLYDNLKTDADKVYLMYGDNTDKENSSIRKELQQLSNDNSLILIATGQKIGEGFDFPRLDTLMLAAPVSFDGRLEQYLGRLNRDYPGKKEVQVYDYIDSHIGMFEKMYSKRLRTYRNVGFTVITDMISTKQTANAIYSSDNYMDTFERDLVEANSRIIISSPDIQINKIDRFLNLISKRQEAGVRITVITTNPDEIRYGSTEFCHSMVNTMISSGIDVITLDEVEEHFAVIDETLVWHGGMNLLGRDDVWDNLMRIHSEKVASELLEIALKKRK
ncbi:MAG: DEAD/DEAH box helicase family protein [Eubacterium sp.]|nr:DEAD/DEAH box helicase family protein [Eubacterium sp.]